MVMQLGLDRNPPMLLRNPYPQYPPTGQINWADQVFCCWRNAVEFGTRCPPEQHQLEPDRTRQNQSS